MKEYSKIEIDTAKNLIRDGYHWIARTPSGKLAVDKTEMLKDVDGWLGSGFSFVVARKWVPIFTDVTWHDDHPTCIDDIAYPPILDSTERRYLERVLRPLPEVAYIKKESRSKETEFLHVEFADNAFCSNDFMDFPYFKKGCMYKGIVLDMEYTPEELKLNLEGKP